MFSSQSIINSVGRNGSNSASISKYWGSPDQAPNITLFPPNTSNITTSELDIDRNRLYIGGTFSKIFQNLPKL
jgi:hypothetical protein